MGTIVFDWQKPFLNSVTEWLLSKSESSEHLDLSHYILLCPVARVSRRLIEKLLFKCEEKNTALSAPQLLSLSKIYEILLPGRKIVTEAESRLLFLTILENKQGLTLFSTLDSDITELQLLDRANFLAQTYLELTKNGLRAEVSIQKILSSDLPGDQQRWQELSEIFNQYKQLLEQHALLDTVDALELVKNSDSKVIRPLILMGSFDLSDVIIQTIEAGFSEIINLIFINPGQADKAFKESGILDTDYWLDCEVNIENDQFQICANPAGEVDSLLSQMQQIKSPASNITVGSCVSSLDKFFAFRAKEYNLPVHLVSGASLLNTEVSQALSAALSYLHSKSFADLSYLLSIPVLYKNLSLLSEARFIIDDYRINHLQPKVQKNLPDIHEKAQNIISETDKLLEPLLSENAVESAQSWLRKCKLFIGSLNSEQPMPVINALEQLLNDISILKISDKALITLISETFSAVNSKQSSDQDEIDVVGWLELALDDAEYCFVTGMNEKNLPARPAANSLLPEKARLLLSLDSYQKRLARDKYILQSLLNSKKYLSLSCSRMSAEGDGLILSKLFLEGSEDNKIKNLERFFKHDFSVSKPANLSVTSEFRADLKQSLLPQSDIWQAENISVSAFNLYYQCPYLFYLQTIKQLKTENPDQRELTGSQLGNLIHNILADFGKSDFKDSINKTEIEEFLLSKLSYYFNRDYAKSTFAEVRVQYFQIIERLQRFADWQAKWCEAGWHIYQVELAFNSSGYTVSTAAGNLNLKGRIDRIDYNSELKEYAVFDYKTSDSLKVQSFSQKQGWQDLQLAIYWLYCKEVLNFEASKLALIPLTASDLDLQPAFLKISADELLQSKDLLIETATKLLNNIFWPPALKAERAFDFQAIYQAVEN